jgi:AcrR family transcriptional regulator
MNRDQRRAALLDAARDVVLRFGYRKTTLEDIAAEAGVSRATVYNYFANKEEVFREIIAQELDRLRESMRLELNPEDPPEERLLAMVRARHRRLKELKKLYRVALDVGRDLLPMPAAELKAFQDDQVALIAGLLREGVELGRFRPVDTEVLGAALYSAYRGLEEDLFFQNHSSLEEGVECLMRTLFTGLLVDPEATP